MEASKQALGATGFWTASARGRESQRADRLLNDPWAQALAGEIGAAWLAQRTEESTIPIILRTRYFDDFLVRIATEDGIRQIVLVAAGLDTRAFRLRWPEGTRLFELDQPAVLNYKEEMLRSLGTQPACERYAIQKDLTESWQEALVDSGFAIQQRSGWLLEGFLFYLSNERIRQILDVVSRLAAAGSWLGCDVINSPTLTSPLTKNWVELQAREGAPWIGTLDEPEEYLASLGWRARLTQAGQADAHHERWVLPVIPTKMPNMPHNWFITAQKE